MSSLKARLLSNRLSASTSRQQKLAACATLLAIILTLFQPLTNSYADYPPANGFTWSIQSRFGLMDSRGIVNFHWNEATASYDYNYINPSSYAIDFNACANGLEDYEGATSNIYNWTFTGRDDPSYVQVASTNNCRPTFNLPKQGNYHAKLVKLVNGSPAYFGSTPFVEQDIYIRDYLVVALGDSYGSGEGAPDIKSQPTGSIFGGYTDPVWEDKRCHRSANSAASQAAITLEQSDPHTAVTFLSFACSGATINRNYNDGLGDLDDPYLPGDSTKPKGSGILGTYRGIQPPTDSYDPATFLPSQIDQIRSAVGNRQIDALIMSAGGNDMGFAPLAASCVQTTDCKNALRYNMYAYGAQDTLNNVFTYDLNAAYGRYNSLASAINSNLNVRKVYVTEYPDSTRGDDGNLCNNILTDANPLGWPVDNNELQWIASTVLPPVSDASMGGMNGQVLSAARRNGWDYVGGIAADFATHGYCANGNWINRAADSPSIENRKDATLHPNNNGYRNIASHIFQHLQPNLSLNPVALADGTLIKGSGASVYAYYKGVRFLVPDANSGYPNYNNPTVISDAQLSSIPMATNDVLVQGAGSSTVWAIYRNVRFVVPASLLPSAFDPAKVITLPVPMLNNIPTMSEGTLVQAQANFGTYNGIWAVYNNARFSVPTQQIFSASYYSRNNIISVPQALLDSINANTDGTIITRATATDLWIMQAGKRQPYSGSGVVHPIPAALFDTIPAYIPAPGVATLSAALALSTYTPSTTTSVRATFTVTNTGGQAMTISELTAAVRDSGNSQYDFPHVTNIVLNPGDTYSYSQTRVFGGVDAYTTWPAALINGNWQNLAGTAVKTFTVKMTCTSKLGCV